MSLFILLKETGLPLWSNRSKSGAGRTGFITVPTKFGELVQANSTQNTAKKDIPIVILNTTLLLTIIYGSKEHTRIIMQFLFFNRTLY